MEPVRAGQVTSPEPATPGVFYSARKLLANLAGLAHTRLELLSTELQEELARLAEILLAAIVSLFFAFLAIAFTAVARGIAARPLVIGSIAALAVVIGPRRIPGWTTRATAFYGLTRQLAAALRDHSR